MVLLRQVLGETLRSARQVQRRTLREVSASAKVSLGYLSEIERGQKEASSELLAAICEALGIELSVLLRDVSEGLAVVELASAHGGGRRLASLDRAVPPVGRSAHLVTDRAA